MLTTLTSIPDVEVIEPYSHIEFQRFVLRGLEVMRVQNSYFGTVIPEVGVVVSTSGQVSKMADVE